MTTPSTTLKTLAILAIGITGLIHLFLARAAFSAAQYFLGALLVAGGLCSLVAAAGIYRNEIAWGWRLGLVVTVGMLLGYGLSRTVGLPGMPATPSVWLGPMGIASLACDALFVLLFGLARRGPSEDILAVGGIRRTIHRT